MDPKKPSLRDRIKVAGSNEEIEKLLAEGEAYAYARTRVRRKWAIAAKARRSELRATK